MEKTDYTGDAPLSQNKDNFNFADRMRFQSLIHGVTEELKMRRELDVENEKKIRKLLNDKFSLGWKLDQHVNEISSLKQQHSVDLRECKRKSDEKLREHKIEVSTSQMYKRLIEKERDALRQEMTKLQLTNYSLEKQSREAERLEKILTNEREEHLKQVSEFDNQHKSLMSEMKKLVEKLDKMENNFGGIQKVQTKLMYENRHYECILRMKDEEIVKLREDLLAARHENKLDPQLVADREDQLKAEIYLQKQKIEEAVESENSGRKHAEILKEKILKGQEQLTEAHRLVKIHLHTAADYRNESKKLQADKEECERKIDETENQLRHVQKELRDLQIRHADDAKASENKTEEFENKVKDLTAELERQARIIDDGDKLLKQKVQLNDELTVELNQIKAILNVEKENGECQTILQMLDTCDSGVQIETDRRSKESQTFVSVQSQSSQTIDPAVRNSGIQTIVVEVSEDEVQTEAGDQQDNCTQTARHGTSDKTSQTDCGLKYTESLAHDKNGISSTQYKHEQTRLGENSAKPRVFQALHKISDDKPVGQNKNSLNKSEIVCPPKDNTPSEKRNQLIKINQNFRDNIVDGVTTINVEQHNLDLSDDLSAVSARADDAVSARADDSITANVNENNPEVGISVPKLDLHKDLLVTEQVVVDPEEFNVSLTQDEIATHLANEQLDENALSTSIPPNTNEFEFNIPPSDHFIEAPNSSGDTRNPGQHNRRIKRSQERELSSTDVENYFSEFEERGRNFKGVTKRPASPNENRAKHIKVSESNQVSKSIGDRLEHTSTATSGEIVASSIDSESKNAYTPKSLDSLETCEANTNHYSTEQRFGSNRLSNETRTTTYTQEWRRSTMSSHGPGRESTRFNTQPPTMTAFDIMQRYKDTVAKIRPMQGQIRPGKQPVGTTSASGSSNSVMTSPRVGTVRGILKGSKENIQGRGCKVSWSEMAEFKVINN